MYILSSAICRKIGMKNKNQDLKNPNKSWRNCMAIFKPQVSAADFLNGGEPKVFQALSKLSDEYVISRAYEWLINKPLPKKKAIGEIDFL